MQQQEEAAHSLHPLQVGPQPLNTPEELRAIRQAMGEGSWSRCPRPRKCSLNSR